MMEVNWEKIQCFPEKQKVLSSLVKEISPSKLWRFINVKGSNEFCATSTKNTNNGSKN